MGNKLYIIVWDVTLVLDPLIKWKYLHFFLLGIFAHACSIRLGVYSIETIKSSMCLVNWAKIWANFLSLIIIKKRIFALPYKKKKTNWAFRLCLGSDERLSLLELLVYFTTVHGSNCTFWYYLWVLLYYSAIF